MNKISTTILLGLALATGCKGSVITQAQWNLVVYGPGDAGTDLAETKSFSFGGACVGVGTSDTFTFVSAVTSSFIAPSDVTTSSAEFSITSIPAATFSLPQDIVIKFNPSGTGPRSGNLTIKSAENALNLPLTIALTGSGSNGAAEPIFDTICPLPGSGTGRQDPCTSLTFTNVYFGATNTLPVTLFNDGGCPPYTVDSVTLYYDGGAFSDGGGVFNLPTLTVPQSVDPSSPYSVVVAYSPNCPTAGCTSTVDIAHLLISTTNGFGGDAGVWSVDLLGTGTAPIVTLAGPMGNQGCNKFQRTGDPQGWAYEREPVTETFTITNGSVSTPVVVGPAGLSGDAGGSNGFTILTGSKCWVAGSGAVLPDGGISLPTHNSSATCDVQFDSASAVNLYPNNGSFYNSLIVPYTALEQGGASQDFIAHVCMYAVSEPAVCSVPTANPGVVLPPVTYCGAASQDIQFSNCGSADLTVNGIDLGATNIGSWSLDLHGQTFSPPEIWKWEDGGGIATITYSDDGGVNNPFVDVIFLANAQGTVDGGTILSVQTQAWGVSPPPELLIPFFQNGGGQDHLVPGTVYEVDMPPPSPAPYAMNWYYKRDGGIIDAGELITDGGYSAWLIPAVTGIYNVCANVVELPLDPPNDGGNCNASVDGGGNCTTIFKIF